MRILFTIMILLMTVTLKAQSFSDKIIKEFSFENKDPGSNALLIANINGNVQVTGYDGDKIIVEITRTIHAKTNARLETGKQVHLGVIDRADSIILYVEGTCQSFANRTHEGEKRGRDWGYEWNNCNKCRDEFDFKMDFTVKVPYSIHLDVSTINDGEIVVNGMKGKVVANNINGGIKLQQLERESEATTINGDLDLEFVTNPKKDCRFYSLNGNINAWVQKGLNAKLSFESFNGNFYTNIDKIDQLPSQLEQNKNGNGMKFKVNGNFYQVGAGGMLLDFETFNGNVYLKERTN